jgi:hypothetical protein
MNNEPERPVEKLLRAWAKKRQDQAGAPFELHPANRRMLQGEVARRFGRREPARRTFWSMLRTYRLQIASVTAILILLALASASFFPLPNRNKPTEMAKNDSAAARSSPDLPAAPPTRSPAAVPAAPVASDSYAKAETPLSALNSAKDVVKNRSEATPAAPAPQPDAGSLLAVQAEGRRTREKQPAEMPALKLESEKLQSNGPLAGEPPPPPPVLAPSSAVAAATTPQGGRGGGLGGGAPSAPKAAPAGAASARDTLNAPAADAVSRELNSNASTGAIVYKSLGSQGLAGNAGSTVALADGFQTNDFSTLTSDRKEATPPQFFYRLGTDRLKESVEALDKEQPGAVLASFQIQRTGSEVRVIDIDGSVYTGEVQPQTEMSRRRLAPQTSAPAAVSGAAATRNFAPAPEAAPTSEAIAQNYFSFRVAGTNRGLNQPVVFTGKVMAGTNAVRLDQSAAGRGAMRLLQIQTNATVQPATRISGTVRVGDRPEVPIDAAPQR